MSQYYKYPATGSGVSFITSVSDTATIDLDVTLGNLTANMIGGGGTVTSVTAGTGLNVGAGPGGTITTSGTLNLANTAVTPGSYTNTNLTVDAQGRITAAANGSGSGSDWSITGNAGTSPGTNFVGTTDAQDLVFKTNATEHLRITAAGELQTLGSLVVSDGVVVINASSAGPGQESLNISNNTLPLAGNLTQLAISNSQTVGGNFKGISSENANTVGGDFKGIINTNNSTVTNDYRGVSDSNSGDVLGQYEGLRVDNISDVTGNATLIGAQFDGDSAALTGISISMQGATRTGQEQAFTIGMSNADTTGKTMLSAVMNGGTHSGGGRLFELNAGTGIYTNWIGLNISHNAIDAGGSETCINIGKSTVDSLSYTGIMFPSNGPATASFTGINLAGYPSTGTTLYKGISVSPAGTFTVTGAQGIDVNMSQVTVTGGEPTSFSSNSGKLGINSNATIRTGTGFTPGNTISMNHITAGDVVGTDFIGNNLLSTYDILDNVDGGSIGLGLSMVGYVGSIQIAAAKTVARLNGAIAGAGTAGTGTLTNFGAYVAAPPFPSTLTIDNYRAFEVLPGFTSGATNNWGLAVRDSSLHNWAAGDMVVGGTTGLPANGEILGVYQDKTDAEVSPVIVTASSHATMDTSAGVIGYTSAVTGIVDATFTNDKTIEGQLNLVNRGDGADDGTLSGIAGVINLIRHNSGAAGVTSTGFGFANITQAQQGTLTDLYDFYSTRSGAGTVTNHYGIYVNADSTTPVKNWLGDKTRIGGTSFSAPTADLHLPGVTAAAGTASLKIDSGTLMTTPEDGAVESDGTHLYWTDDSGVRQQLDGGGSGGTPIVLNAGGTPTGTLDNTENAVIYGTVAYDSASAYNNTTGEWTCPATGDFNIYAAYEFDGVEALDDVAIIGVNVNGATVYSHVFTAVAGISRNAPVISVQVHCDAGDIVTIVSQTSITTPVYQGGTVRNWFQISNIAGSAGGGSGTVTSVTAGVGLNGGTITAAGTIDLADTAVTPGSYTLANITVDQQGRLTAASSSTPFFTSQGSPPTIAVQGSAGTGASATLTSGSTDAAGQITIVTGTIGISTGSYAQLTFVSTANRICVISPASSTLSTSTYVTSSTTTMDINFAIAGGVSATYVINYHAITY